MNQEDLRLRLFTPVRGLAHTVAARLSQLDYDREMGLIAERRGIGALVGEVMRENRRMLAMCHEFGFTALPDPDDAAVVTVGRPLGLPHVASH